MCVCYRERDKEVINRNRRRTDQLLYGNRRFDLDSKPIIFPIHWNKEENHCDRIRRKSPIISPFRLGTCQGIIIIIRSNSVSLLLFSGGFNVNIREAAQTLIIYALQLGWNRPTSRQSSRQAGKCIIYVLRNSLSLGCCTVTMSDVATWRRSGRRSDKLCLPLFDNKSIMTLSLLMAVNIIFYSYLCT